MIPTDEKARQTYLSPARFVWEKYCGKLGWATSQLVKDSYGCIPELLPDVRFVGWTWAKDIRIRQRDEGYVIMVEIDGEDTWFHVNELPSNA